MILSMTGFGKAEASYGDKKFLVEMKSLNGKTTDIRFRFSNNLREKEVPLRNMIIDHAKRGKIEYNITVQSEGAQDIQLNKALFTAYAQELSKLEQDLGIQGTDLTAAILRLPNVVMAEEGKMSDEEWQVIQDATLVALDDLKVFRKHEGLAMLDDLHHRASEIQRLLDGIAPFEKERITALRVRMKKHLEDFLGKDNVDKNRYEQEVLYYLEKLDINEERVRLGQHCDFFLSELNSQEEEAGRKLSFIAQEMGREINTLGSKAQHSGIQKHVVSMKDQLEKIKEQLANIV
jgi:uncharacterized protein (TIGR00255 family)